MASARRHGCDPLSLLESLAKFLSWNRSVSFLLFVAKKDVLLRSLHFFHSPYIHDSILQSWVSIFNQRLAWGKWIVSVSSSSSSSYSCSSSAFSSAPLSYSYTATTPTTMSFTFSLLLYLDSLFFFILFLILHFRLKPWPMQLQFPLLPLPISLFHHHFLTIAACITYYYSVVFLCSFSSFIQFSFDFISYICFVFISPTQLLPLPLLCRGKIGFCLDPCFGAYTHSHTYIHTHTYFADLKDSFQILLDSSSLSFFLFFLWVSCCALVFSFGFFPF